MRDCRARMIQDVISVATLRIATARLVSKSAGAACFTTWECDVGLYCAHDGTSTGACAPLVADGGACTANEECISGFCRTTGTPAACTVPTQDELYCIEPV